MAQEPELAPETARRLELQSLLEEALGSSEVWFQPPVGFKMSYPAIRYKLDGDSVSHADNHAYRRMRRYEVLVIGRDPDTTVTEKIASWPYARFERRYTAENLYHDVITLHF